MTAVQLFALAGMVFAATFAVTLAAGSMTVKRVAAAKARTLAAAREDAAELRDRAREDADLIRSEAEAIRLQARTEGDDLRTHARAEADELREGARTDARKLRVEARADAERESARLVAAAREAADREQVRLTTAATKRSGELDRREERLDQRDKRVSAEAERVSQESTRLADEATRLSAQAIRLHEQAERVNEREQTLIQQHKDLVARNEEFDHQLEAQLAERERIAGLSADQAKTELVETVVHTARREAALLARQIERDAKAEADDRARRVVVDAIQRVASAQTTESTVSVLTLPSDELKGRIIGREGRNIRTFESITGVNVIIDDTPEAVLLSCFDPVRREVGRLTLEKLVLDGRIHPQRIEDAFVHATKEVDQVCAQAAEAAVIDSGLAPLHPELMLLLGRLRFRTSYGQNVLKHLTETAHIAGAMAAELGIPTTLVKRAAFLHDIGKALTHEVEGSHALVGADLARKYGEPEEVVHAIAAHHNEVPPETVEAVLTQAADSCSGGRPGARRESLESYVQRLQRIEEIASTRDGVDKVFAMQAGREVRIMVQPEEIDDIAAAVLARDVAKQIEEELTYPGQIKVTVVRETRATETAR